jgi:hypothetical protein
VTNPYFNCCGINAPAGTAMLVPFYLLPALRW